MNEDGCEFEANVSYIVRTRQDGAILPQKTRKNVLLYSVIRFVVCPCFPEAQAVLTLL